MAGGSCNLMIHHIGSGIPAGSGIPDLVGISPIIIFEDVDSLTSQSFPTLKIPNFL